MIIPSTLLIKFSRADRTAACSFSRTTCHKSLLSLSCC
ncbi:unnamed protein product [Tenebrio molitor]|nr:unnamed protein product [Tenebrio molitor]